MISSGILTNILETKENIPVFTFSDYELPVGVLVPRAHILKILDFIHHIKPRHLWCNFQDIVPFINDHIRHIDIGALFGTAVRPCA